MHPIIVQRILFQVVSVNRVDPTPLSHVVEKEYFAGSGSHCPGGPNTRFQLVLVLTVPAPLSLGLSYGVVGVIIHYMI